MPRINEVENGEIIVVSKNTDDKFMPEGHHSPIFIEKDWKENDVKYFYDAGGNKRYVKDALKYGNIEIS